QISGDMPLRFALGPGSGSTQSPPGPQRSDELSLACAAALAAERLVDCFVTDSHSSITGDLELQPLRDLFRTPRDRPSPVSTMGLVPALARRDRRPGNHGTVW